MYLEKKIQIVKELRALVEKSSQNKVATKAGVSSAIISQMLNEKWDTIADDMFRRVAVNLKIATSWMIAQTKNFKDIWELCALSQTRHFATAVAYDAGAGKSSAYRAFANEGQNVIYIECKNYWSKKSYVEQLLISTGHKPQGTTEECIERFINAVKEMNNPLIIIDQADKLKDSSLDLFMDFYNELEDHCGFVISGVPALEKRILRGVQRDRIGYAEFYSRIGRRFIKLTAPSVDDVYRICRANGADDKELARMIHASADGDLRRVRREVEKNLLINAAA
jgi:DNA transposition AAA+ family ATPase